MLQFGVELAAFGELEDEVYILVVFEDGVQLDDSRMRQLAQDVDLVLQLVFHVIVLDSFLCYNFHRIVFVALPVLHFDHFAVRAYGNRGIPLPSEVSASKSVSFACLVSPSKPVRLSSQGSYSGVVKLFIIIGMERLDRVRDKLRRESAEMIDRMKSKLVPIDFKSIDQHDRSYLANMYIKQREKELDRINKQRSAVDRHVYTSKTYDRVRDEYIQNRQSRGDLGEDKTQRMKLYSDKLKLIQQLDPQAPPPSSSETHLYGRFDREWHKKLNEQEEGATHHKSVLDIGNRYMSLGKAAAAKKSTASDPAPQRAEAEEPKPAENKGQEYLKHARSMAKKRVERDRDEIDDIMRKIELLRDV